MRAAVSVADGCCQWGGWGGLEEGTGTQCRSPCTPASACLDIVVMISRNSRFVLQPGGCQKRECAGHRWRKGLTGMMRVRAVHAAMRTIIRDFWHTLVAGFTLLCMLCVNHESDAFASSRCCREFASVGRTVSLLPCSSTTWAGLSCILQKLISHQV